HAMLEHLRDMRALDVPGNFRLALKPMKLRRMACERSIERLDGDFPVERGKVRHPHVRPRTPKRTHQTQIWREQLAFHHIDSLMKCPRRTSPRRTSHEYRQSLDA